MEFWIWVSVLAFVMYVASGRLLGPFVTCVLSYKLWVIMTSIVWYLPFFHAFGGERWEEERMDGWMEE